MLVKPNDLNAGYIDSLVAGGIPEDQDREYKQVLPDKAEEFCKDVSALANADGGVIIYGLREDVDGAPQLSPLIFDGSTWDERQLQLQSWLDSLIEPRIHGCRFIKIDHPSGLVMALHVPASHGGPHWCGPVGRRRFVMRRGNKVADYTYHELRQGFDRSASAMGRANAWIAARIAELKAGRSIRPLKQGAIIAVHVVPLAGYFQNVPKYKFDANITQYLPNIFGSHSWTLNFEGMAIYPTGGTAYTQLFHDGSIEAIVYAGHDVDTEHMLIGARVAKHVRAVMAGKPRAWSVLDISGSALLSVSLLNIKGLRLAANHGYAANAILHANDMIASPYFIDDVEDAAAFSSATQDALDLIWQGFDLDHCDV